jgi:hypothetical protein
LVVTGNCGIAKIKGGTGSKAEVEKPGIDYTSAGGSFTRAADTISITVCLSVLIPMVESKLRIVGTSTPQCFDTSINHFFA